MSVSTPLDLNFGHESTADKKQATATAAANASGRPNWKRLLAAVDRARRDLNGARRQQVTAVRQYVGAHYEEAREFGMDAGSKDVKPLQTPVNFLPIIVDTLITFIAARRPQALVGTKHNGLKRTADRLNLGLNHLLQEIKLEQSLQMAANDAMFSMGVMKVGVTPWGDMDFGDEVVQVGQTYAESIQFDDYFYDTNARRFSACAFKGNIYRVPLDYVKKSGLFKPELVKGLTATQKQNQTPDGQVRIDSLGTDFDRTGPDEEYRDYIDLMDIWLRAENLVVTFPVENPGLTPIREEPYFGPEGGPYEELFFAQPPGNIRPVPPIYQWLDINNFLNSVFRKLERQGRRQRTIGVADDLEMAGRIMNASDGEVVQGDPAMVKELRLGGMDPPMFAFFIQMKDLLLGALSGNIQALAGLGQLTETAKQDKMIRESASLRVQRMQEAMMSFVTRVIEKLAWFLFYDPLLEIPAVKRAPNSGIELPLVITAEDMEGDYLDYNFEIQPYSMQYISPQEKRAKIHAELQDTIMPMYPFMQQQGASVDFQRLIEIDAELLNVPELLEIVTFAEPEDMIPPVGTPPEHMQPMPQQKEVIHANIPTGGTQDSRDNTLAASLLGGAVNQDQQAAQGLPGV